MINTERTRVRDLLANPPIGEVVTVWGWVRTGRVSPRVIFVHLNDGTTMAPLQLVLDRENPNVPSAQGIATGACVRAVGVVRESPAKGQDIEIQVTSLEVVGAADETYPLQKKAHTLEFLRTQPHLRTRTNTLLSLFRVRSELSYAIHEYLHERGFAYVHPPLVTRSDCEGAGQAFRITSLDLNAVRAHPFLADAEDYFGRPAYLTVSAQMEAEALALGLGEVYTFGPIFRADPSDTSRHAAEFWMIEPEMAFYDFQDLLDAIEDFVKEVTRRVRRHCGNELEFLRQKIEPEIPHRLELLIDQPFGRVTYTEAISILTGQEKRFGIPPRWGDELASEHERFLVDEVYKQPVFVTDYPETFKPFYMRLNDDQKTVACLDLLAPRVGELLTGSQREERYTILEQRLAKRGLSRPDYEWYLQTRRWGSAPHSGFGIGLERILMYISGMKNIRDVLPFPRTFGSI